MKLWLLTRAEHSYDEAVGFVVRARNEEEAREFAAKNCGDEGPNVWLDVAVCEPLVNRGDPGVVLRDFYEA